MDGCCFFGSREWGDCGGEWIGEGRCRVKYGGWGRDCGRMEMGFLVGRIEGLDIQEGMIDV